MESTFQIGLDIATAISIIGAAWSFAKTQDLNRRQRSAQYSVQNLMDLLKFFRRSTIDYDALWVALKKDAKPERVGPHIAGIIFFLESVVAEMEAQAYVYFPVFHPTHTIPPSILNSYASIKKIMEDIKKTIRDADGDLNRAVLNTLPLIEEIPRALRSSELAVANELKKILNGGI